MSETKSPSFRVIFNTVFKIFIAIVLLVVVLNVIAFFTCTGLYNLGNRRVEQVEQSLKTESSYLENKGCEEAIPETWTDEQVANFWKWCEQ